jgi:hypothetical protein
MVKNDLQEDLRLYLKKIAEVIKRKEGTEVIDENEILDRLGRIRDYLLQADKVISELENISDQNFFKTLNDKYTDIKKHFNEINEVDSIFVDNINKIIYILRELENLCKTKEDEILNNRKVFGGREEDAHKKIRKKIVNLKKIIVELEEESLELRDLADKMKDQSKGITPEIIDLLNSLKFGGDIWAHELVAKISGLRSVSGDLYTEETTIEGVIWPDEEEEKSLPIELLFLRYPPFEPIYKEVDGIKGRCIWFIGLENGIIEPKEVIEETAEFDKNRKLIRVRPKDLFRLKNASVTVKIKTGGTPVFVKYGSKKLFDELRKYKYNTTKVQEEYKKYVEKIKGKATTVTYSATNLSYVWFCSRGLGISTDPYDLTCPFVKECIVGRQRDKCDKWNRSRRLFPKVFVTSEKKINFHENKLEEDFDFVFLKPLAAKGVRIRKKYNSAQWYMPTVISEGLITEAKFKNPIIENLPKTNIVGFKIPTSILEAIIDSIFDENNSQKPEVTVLHPNKKVSIDKILLSKFYIYNKTREGLNAFGFLSKSSTEILKDFESFKNKKEDIYIRLRDYLIDVTCHTLAHLFVTFISNSLEIEIDDLLYIYDKSEEGELLIAIAENSMLGSIDIPLHAKIKFGTLNNMVHQFVKETVHSLSKHIEELGNFAEKQRKDIGRSELGPMVDKIREKYENFVNQGLVMDITTFVNHLVLNGEDKKIAKELDIEDVRDALLDAITSSGINTCLDGCTACIMLERRCEKPLIQNLNLSLNLLLHFLKILLGEEIKGRGDRLGLAILNQAKERLFAFSPYIDDDGAKFLAELARKGVKIVLMTYEKFASKYKNILNYPNIDIYTLKNPKHYKFYIIDRRMLIKTSQNLSNLSSINDFEIRNIRPEDADKLERKELENGEAFERE